MLIDEMLHRHNDGASGTSNIGGFDPNGYQPSGADSAANELENRPVDFGNGGNDWDSGSVDTGDSGGGGWD